MISFISITAIFGAVSFLGGIVLILIYRKKIKRFTALLFPFCISFITFLSYSMTPPGPMDWITTAFTFLMWGSWLSVIFFLLKIVEKKRELL